MSTTLTIDLGSQSHLSSLQSHLNHEDVYWTSATHAHVHEVTALPLLLAYMECILQTDATEAYWHGLSCFNHALFLYLCPSLFINDVISLSPLAVSVLDEKLQGHLLSRETANEQPLGIVSIVRSNHLR